MRPRARSRRPNRPLAALALALASAGAPAWLGACRAAAPGRVSAPAPQPSLNTPALRALQAALEEEEDELAQRLVATLRTRELTSEEDALVAAAERVLAGRELVRALELTLESVPVEGAPEGAFQLRLRARSRAATPLRLSLPPADLKRMRVAMDAHGMEGIEYESRACTALGALEVPAGGERELELFSYELPIGRALAVRETWALATRSGEIEGGGTSYPAARVAVSGCERERLSPFVEARTLEARALADFLVASEPPPARALLEVAMGIPIERRPAALDALTPVVMRLSQEDPERVKAAEPALRWLTGERDLGADPASWARWLRVRQERAREAEQAADGLDLPAGPRAAR